MPESVSLTVLVDGGASGCRLQARNACGMVCVEAQAGPASLSVGADRNQAWQNIQAGIAELARLGGYPAGWQPKHLVMGLAGALHAERRNQLSALAEQRFECVTLVTDGHAQLLGASAGNPGACLAVGTGSVLHWINSKGESGMAGGWGFPAGDEASGAWLGLLAVNRFVQLYDLGYHLGNDSGHDAAERGRQKDPFFTRMCEVLGSTVTHIQNWTTCKSPTQLATLAPELVQLLGAGSEVACDLLDQGTQALENLLSYAPAELPVYLAGGLAEVYRPRLGETWQSRLRVSNGSVFDGLWHLALTEGYASHGE